MLAPAVALLHRRFLQIFRSNGASSLTLQQKLKLAGGVALGMHCLHDCSPQILRECSLAFTHALACQLHAVLLADSHVSILCLLLLQTAT